MTGPEAMAGSIFSDFNKNGVVVPIKVAKDMFTTIASPTIKPSSMLCCHFIVVIITSTPKSKPIASPTPNSRNMYLNAFFKLT